MARVGHAPVDDDLHRRRWAVLLRPVLVLPALALLLALVVLAVVAAVLHALAARPRPAERRADGTLVTLHEHFWTPVLGWLALGFVALGLLVL